MNRDLIARGFPTTGLYGCVLLCKHHHGYIHHGAQAELAVTFQQAANAGMRVMLSVTADSIRAANAPPQRIESTHVLVGF